MLYFKNWIYYNSPVEVRLRFRAWRYRVQGHTGIGDPLRIYEVAPSIIDRGIPVSKFGRDVPEFGVVGGKWHERAVDLRDRGTPTMLVEHFENGVPWEKTENYQKVIEKIEKGEGYGPFDEKEPTIPKYDMYLSYLDELYKDMEKSGYKRQEDLDQDDDFLNRNIHPVLNEIQVFIGPDGELMCKSGAHRLVIAKILNLDTVPVRTQVRHRTWQDIRDSIAITDEMKQEDFSEFLDHPELRDLLPDERVEQGAHKRC